MGYTYHITLAVLSLLFSYNLCAARATKVVGDKISSVDGGSLQDAITPPLLTKITLITWAAIAITLGYEIYKIGIGGAALSLGVFVVVSAIAGGAVIPGPESKHFLALIHRSMVNRAANYEREYDRQRAEAMDELRQRFEVVYKDTFTSQ